MKIIKKQSDSYQISSPRPKTVVAALQSYGCVRPKTLLLFHEFWIKKKDKKIKKEKNLCNVIIFKSIILLDRKLLLEKEECNIKSNFNAGNFNQSADDFFCMCSLISFALTFVDS
jgi:hypothetical protein